MDMIKYEKLEDFLNLLKRNNKQVVYMNILKTQQKDSPRITSSILFHTKIAGILHEHIYKDDMPEVVIAPEWVFGLLTDEKLKKNALENYRSTLKEFDSKVKEEYDKAVELVKDPENHVEEVIMGMVIQ